MVTATPRAPAALFLTKATAHKATTHDGLMLVDVKGELDAPDLRSWRGLLRSATTEDVTGIAVDLRGCPAIDFDCLSAMVAASVHLKSRGDRGVNVVTTPGSPLERRVQAAVALELPAYSSAAEALHSLRDAP